MTSGVEQYCGSLGIPGFLLQFCFENLPQDREKIFCGYHRLGTPVFCLIMLPCYLVSLMSTQFYERGGLLPFYFRDSPLDDRELEAIFRPGKLTCDIEL